MGNLCVFTLLLKLYLCLSSIFIAVNEMCIHVSILQQSMKFDLYCVVIFLISGKVLVAG